MKMNSPGAKFKKMLAVCLAAVLLFAIGSIAVYKQSASHSTEVLSKTGSRGEEVRQIQTKLKSKGIYSGSVDGIYGTLTKDAVKKFQKSAGLTADGIAGPKTLSALGIGSASSGQYSSRHISACKGDCSRSERRTVYRSGCSGCGCSESRSARVFSGLNSRSSLSAGSIFLRKRQQLEHRAYGTVKKGGSGRNKRLGSVGRCHILL